MKDSYLREFQLIGKYRLLLHSYLVCSEGPKLKRSLTHIHFSYPFPQILQWKQLLCAVFVMWCHTSLAPILYDIFCHLWKPQSFYINKNTWTYNQYNLIGVQDWLLDVEEISSYAGVGNGCGWERNRWVMYRWWVKWLLCSHLHLLWFALEGCAL